MSETYEAKKYWADKIAMSGLFIGAVLIARLIIVSRSAVVLSEPIKSNCAALSVSIPAGNGWQSEKQSATTLKIQKRMFAIAKHKEQNIDK